MCTLEYTDINIGTYNFKVLFDGNSYSGPYYTDENIYLCYTAKILWVLIKLVVYKIDNNFGTIV